MTSHIKKKKLQGKSITLPKRSTKREMSKTAKKVDFKKGISDDTLKSLYVHDFCSPRHVSIIERKIADTNAYTELSANHSSALPFATHKFHLSILHHEQKESRRRNLCMCVYLCVIHGNFILQNIFSSFHAPF